MIEIRGKNFVAYNASESVWESIIKDVFTGLMLSFCVYISHWSASVFWTFISGLMFLSYLGIKLGRLMRSKLSLKLGQSLKHGSINKPNLKITWQAMSRS